MVIILLFASLSNTKDGYAFDWFSKYILTVQGTITNLIFSNEEQREPIVSGDGPHSIESEPATDIKIIQNKMTLQDAQTVTKFNILVPKSIPDEYTLSHVNVLLSGETKSTDIELLYDSGHSTLSIREIMLESKISASSIFDNEDTVMKEIMIHGQKGTLLFFKDGSNLLVWSNANFQFSIKSSLSEEILIEIAQALLS
ncbi:MAG: DUF4367 domain-containing protein [Paenibacillaceae bacterium]